MLKLMEYSVEEGLAENSSDFMEKIGNTKYNLAHVKNGRQGFTKAQILKACKLTGASADFVFGLTDSIILKVKRV